MNTAATLDPSAVTGDARARGALVSGRTVMRILIVALLVSFPHLPFIRYSVLGNVNRGAHFALIAVSIVVLTGWVGQISLGQAGFVGVGAYVTGIAAGALNVTFPVSMIWGAIAGTLVAMIFGIVALRVRGLYLAVATLIFSWMAEAFLFRQEWFTRYAVISLRPIGEQNTIPYFDWREREVFYYAAWATVLLAIFLMSNLRQSKNGRAFFAVRGSEVAAASLGINVIKTKLTAFAISGFLAGAAGGLLIVMDGSVSPDALQIKDSLLFLSIAVVGGLSSLGGSIAAGLLFAFLNELFFRVEALGGYLNVASAVLLAGTLLLYRGGLAAIPESIRPRISWLAGKLQPIIRPVRKLGAFLSGAISRFGGGARDRPSGDRPRGLGLARVLRFLPRAKVATGKSPRVPPLDLFDLGTSAEAGDSRVSTGATTQGIDGQGSTQPITWRSLVTPREEGLRPDRTTAPSLIEASGITVRFGGLTACSNVSLKVCQGEIVGLIGPNGAGKTTFFNAVAGLNEPASGRVNIYADDVTSRKVHERAERGVARTFQAIQLFGQLSVFENLLVATHQHNRSTLAGNLLVTRRALEAEAEARRQVRRVVELFELQAFADRPAKDLPFGVLRMVELARALVTRSRIIMLDEPASGLDNNETDNLIEILRFVRSLGVTLLLIEHDVRMVTSVSDYIYVLDGGVVLAEGIPEEIQRNESVIAAYLGQALKKEEEPV